MMGVTSITDSTALPFTIPPAPPTTAYPTKQPTPLPTPRPSRKPTSTPTLRPTDTPTSSHAPTITCYRVEIGLIFDEYPGETRWEITKGRRTSIGNPDSAVVVKTSPFYDPNNGYEEASETHIACLPEGKYTFTIMDRNKDGICCDNGEGRYAVTYQSTGELIGHGSEFEQYESISFAIPYVAPPLRDADGDGIEDRTKNVIPPMILNDNGMPVSECENEFGLHLQTDDYGVETTWELRERSSTDNYQDGKMVASGGPYTSDYIYDISYCLYPGKYTFVFIDWQCDGLVGKELTGSYTLKVNGKEVHTGGTEMDKYWEEVKLEFANDQPDAAGSSNGVVGRACTLMAIIVSVCLTVTAVAM